MTRSMKPLSLFIWRFLIVLPFAVCLLQSQGSAQTNGALSLLKQYQAEVAKVREVAGKLGPYTIECGNGGGTFTVDFGSARSQLLSVLQQAEAVAGASSAFFLPTQAWIDKLPWFRQQFDAEADRVLGVQRDIKAGNGPTDQQRQIVAQALINLTDLLDSSSGQLRRATSVLAGFLQLQSQYRQSIAQAIAGLDQSPRDLLNRLLSSYPKCDGSSIEAQFNSIKGQFSISIQEFSQASQNLGTSSRAAETAVAASLAFVVTNQTDVKSVGDMVNAAKADQLGSFLQRLRLDAAKNRLAMLTK